MDFRTLLQSMHTLSEATKDTPTGKIHTADPGGYGRKDDEETDDDGNSKKVKPASTGEKRGKGRPKKATQSSGEAKKYDFSAFGATGKDVKLPKYDKKKTTKHSIKEYIDQLESAINEEGITIKPMPGASQIIGADGKSMGTADAATANTIKQASEKGTLNLGGEDEQMNEKSESPASSKGKYAGKSKSELIKAYNHLKSMGPHQEGSKPHGNMKELATAIRAKGQFGKSEEKEVDESALQAYLGDKKYGKEGMNALRAAGQDHASEKKMQNIRAQYSDNEDVAEAKDLPGKQEKLDIAEPKGKLDAKDFAALRAKKSVKESVLNDSTGSTLDHICKTFSREVSDFRQTGEMDDDLFQALYDYYFDDMPYGTKKARDGDPHEWISNRFGKDMPLDEGSMQDFTTHGMDSKPARFSPAATKPEPTSWKVDPIQATTDRAIDAGSKAGSFLRNLVAPKKTFESTDMKDVQLESWEKELNSLLNEGITVTSSQGQQGTPDSVSINATDSDAQELLSIVRQAGLGVFGGGNEQEHSGYGAPMSGDEGGNGTEPQMPPSVVGDGDDMMALIKKMSGIQSDAGPSNGGEEGHESPEQAGPEGTLTPDYEEETDREETDEGNEFSGELAKAKAQHQDEFKVDGKTYPVKEEGQVPSMDEGHDSEEGGSCNECGMYEARCVCSQLSLIHI